MKTLVVGLDAATWSIIDPLLEQERLPHLQSILDNGVRGKLESTLPPMTPPAWTSMATGVDPGTHGIYDFLTHDTDTYRIQTVDYAKMICPTVWDVLHSQDEDVGVFNFPLASPPSEVTPFFVSGFPASAKEEIAYPDSIQSSLDAVDYRVTPDADPKDGPTAYYRDVVELTETQTQVVLDLIERHDPALCWTVFMGIDWIQHYLWGKTVDGNDAVELFYEFIDGILGRLLEAVSDETTVVVVSDHGACRIDSEIHTNNLMERWQHLTRTVESARWVDRLQQKLSSTAWVIGRQFPNRVKSWLIAGLPDDTLDGFRTAADVGQFGLHKDILWNETTVFSYGSMGKLFVHRTDWYPDGTVPPSEYDATVEDVVSRLEALEHPSTGDPLVSEALPGRTVYSAEPSPEMPDILFVPTDWRYMAAGDFDREWITEPDKRLADHHRQGVFLATGPEIALGAGIDLPAAAVAPFLLRLHSLPLLEKLDSDVPTSLFTDAFLSDSESTVIASDRIDSHHASSTRTESEVVEQHLEELGYL